MLSHLSDACENLALKSANQIYMYFVLCFAEVAQARGQINRAEKVPHEQQTHFFIKVSYL